MNLKNSQNERDQRQKERIAAVRRVVWNEWSKEDGSFDGLHDVLVDATNVVPTPEHVKAVFTMMPVHILSQGIQWGFMDTEVRESMYDFVKENLDEVHACLAAV